MKKVNYLPLFLSFFIIAVILITGCSPKPSTTSTSSPTTSASTASTSTGKPASTTSPNPSSEVDIYTKSGPWPYKDPADNVMSPSVLGFAWNLNQDPDAVAWAHRNGAKFIAEVSLWNHDSWRTLNDLPASLKTAYNTGWDGNPLFIQEMVYLNINHPAFQQWLKDFMRWHIDQGADGFVFDETGGSADVVYMGGGFDAYSMAGFGDYLAGHYTAAELQALQITDTGNFDYKKYLTTIGEEERYQQGDLWNVTLGPDYFSFLQWKTSEVIIELTEEARSYAASRGKTILISANADPFYREPSRGFYDVLDYYTFEHGFIHNTWRLEAGQGYATFPYGVQASQKIKYALGQNQKAVVLMTIGEYGDLGKLGLDAGTSLVLHDFAEVYANLGFFCYFDLEKAFIGNQFVADHARLRPYYAFLREHPELFNGLDAAPEAAVILPPLSLMSDTGPVDSAQGVSFVLSESNIPYDVINIDAPLDYKVVIANGFAWSDEQLNKLLDFARSGGTVIAIDERFAAYDGNYKEIARPELDALKTNGTHNLGAGRFIFFQDYVGWKYWAYRDMDSFNLIKNTVMPWVTPGSAPAGVQLVPYTGDEKMVIHILNYNYARQEFITQKDFNVSVPIPKGFMAEGKTLTLLSPDGNAGMTLQYTVEGNQLKFNVPELYIWSAAVL